MSRKLTSFLTLLLLSSALFATDYYVDAVNGNDRNQGTSVRSAFKSLQKISRMNLRPGDVVNIMNGTYSTNSSTLLRIDDSGTENNWITIRNYKDHQPLLQFNSWIGIDLVNGASYIKIQGLRVKGARSKITLEEALAQPAGCQSGGGGANGLYNGTGIQIVGPNLKWSNPATTGNEIPHHIVIEDCEVFDCTSSGITFQQADYVTVRNNKVYNNCWYTIYGTSGINLYQFINVDGTTGQHNSITNNLMYGNQLRVPQVPFCSFLDGNGLIVDDFRHLQVGNYKDSNIRFPAYSASTLIANNISVENGGSGLHFFLSTNCNVYNNTVVNNAFQNEGVNGNAEVRIGGCINFEVKNNIFQSKTRIHSNEGNSRLSYTHNFQFGPEIDSTLVDCSDCLTGELLFSNQSATSEEPYRTSNDSLVARKGVSTSLFSNDFLDNIRDTSTGAFDIGAYALDSCILKIWYADLDGDGAGDAADSITACDQPEGYILIAGDECPDNSSATASTIWYADVDKDGFGDENDAVNACEQPEGYVSIAGDKCPENPLAIESAIWYADVDEDGFGDANDTITACEQPEGYVSIDGDECPNDPTETVGTTWYADFDNDGAGNPEDVIASCIRPDGYIATTGDQCPLDANKLEPGECGCGVEEGNCTPPTSSEICNSPAYNAKTIYDVAGSIVLYKGRVYKNKWYARNDTPSDGGPWELLEVCEAQATDCSQIPDWNSNTRYREAGSQVVYENRLYINKWYSRNDTPGTARVWEFVDICQQQNSALFAVQSANTLSLESNVLEAASTLIYPTQTSDLINVQSPIDQELQIFSITGKPVLNSNLKAGMNQVDLNTLNPGMYLIKNLNTGETSRIVKQ